MLVFIVSITHVNKSQHYYFKQIMQLIDTEIDVINDDMLKTHDILIYNPIFITGCECKRHKSFY